MPRTPENLTLLERLPVRQRLLLLCLVARQIEHARLRFQFRSLFGATPPAVPSGRVREDSSWEYEVIGDRVLLLGLSGIQIVHRDHQRRAVWRSDLETCVGTSRTPDAVMARAWLPGPRLVESVVNELIEAGVLTEVESNLLAWKDDHQGLANALVDASRDTLDELSASWPQDPAEDAEHQQWLLKRAGDPLNTALEEVAELVDVEDLALVALRLLNQRLSDAAVEAAVFLVDRGADLDWQRFGKLLEEVRPDMPGDLIRCGVRLASLALRTPLWANGLARLEQIAIETRFDTDGEPNPDPSYVADAWAVPPSGLDTILPVLLAEAPERAVRIVRRFMQNYELACFATAVMNAVDPAWTAREVERAGSATHDVCLRVIYLEYLAHNGFELNHRRLARALELPDISSIFSPGDAAMLTQMAHGLPAALDPALVRQLKRLVPPEE